MREGSVRNNLMKNLKVIIPISLIFLFTTGCIYHFNIDKAGILKAINFAKDKVLKQKLNITTAEYYAKNSCFEYIVKPGDTFYSIYCKKGSRIVTYDEFIELNSHIKDINSITPGEAVYFPSIDSGKSEEHKEQKTPVKIPLSKTTCVKKDGSEIIIHMAKIDPHLYNMEIYYGNKSGLTIDNFKKDDKIRAAINGGFFSPGDDYFPIGLLINKGKKLNTGTDLWSNSGIFYITTDPFDPYGICTGEDFYETDVKEALQSFPLLLWNGKPCEKYEDKEEASRSAIGTDMKGNILLIATESRITGGLTINEFSEALSLTDWNIHKALNLDGGSSTQFYVKNLLSIKSKAGFLGEDKVSNFIVVREK